METVKSNLIFLAEKETEIKRLEERLTKMEEEMKKFSKDGPKISQVLSSNSMSNLYCLLSFLALSSYII